LEQLVKQQQQELASLTKQVADLHAASRRPRASAAAFTHPRSQPQSPSARPQAAADGAKRRPPERRDRRDRRERGGDTRDRGRADPSLAAGPISVASSRAHTPAPSSAGVVVLESLRDRAIALLRPHGCHEDAYAVTAC
jgi:hypothetical protein